MAAEVREVQEVQVAQEITAPEPQALLGRPAEVEARAVQPHLLRRQRVAAAAATEAVAAVPNPAGVRTAVAVRADHLQRPLH